MRAIRTFWHSRRPYLMVFRKKEEKNQPTLHEVFFETTRLEKQALHNSLKKRALLTRFRGRNSLIYPQDEIVTASSPSPSSSSSTISLLQLPAAFVEAIVVGFLFKSLSLKKMVRKGGVKEKERKQGLDQSPAR